MQTPRAKKSLGQNFLQDQNIARKIVDLLELNATDFVLEIGPGPGMLTRFLYEAAPASLFLIEKDSYWADKRRIELENSKTTQVTVLNADALRVEWSKHTEPCKIVGNLPYNVASPLMWDIVSQATGLQQAVFMVQKEVAERLVAVPGTAAYGLLSVWIQAYAKVKLEFIVPPQVFKPSPKVFSAVVSFYPLAQAERPLNPVALAKLLKLLFQQRRKQIGGILKQAGFNFDLFAQENIAPTLRAENIAVETYKKVSAKL